MESTELASHREVPLKPASSDEAPRSGVHTSIFTTDEIDQLFMNVPKGNELVRLHELLKDEMTILEFFERIVRNRKAVVSGKKDVNDYLERRGKHSEDKFEASVKFLFDPEVTQAWEDRCTFQAARVEKLRNVIAQIEPRFAFPAQDTLDNSVREEIFNMFC